MLKQRMMPNGAPVEWRASFAWSEEHGGPGLAVRRFRRVIELDAAPAQFPVHVSADSRYVLWVNGRQIGRGPLKGTPTCYFYETYDLAPHLRAGRNVIAADVRWFGADTPASEVHGPRAGFLLQGPDGAGVDTPGEWKVLVDEAVTADTEHFFGNAWMFLGHMEHFDASAYRRGWTELDFDDSSWERTIEEDPADVFRGRGVFPPRDLHAREVAHLVEEPRRFVRTIRDHAVVEHAFGEQPAGWTLQAGEGGEITLDVGCLTTGYLTLEMAGGAGRTVTITYAECMFERRLQDADAPAEGAVRDVWVKNVRDDFANGEAAGYCDTVELDGRDLRYEPFHWRTFWFVKIGVGPGPEPFTLREATYRFTTYPQELKATFESSDPDSRRMFAMSWRTLQLCAHETYEDCPYYEQLQYLADTRLEAMLSMTMAGETELARRAIRLFHDSVRPDGLLHSRVPAMRRQIIPYFALLWIEMLEDYWRWTGPREAAFVRSMLHVADGVLWHFREHLREDGFLGPVDGWHCVDQANPVWGNRGAPLAAVDGGSTYMTCVFTRAMDAGVRLHTETGEPMDADRWRVLADRLRAAVRQGAWSEKEGLFLEGPGRVDDAHSQHSQVGAILADVATPAQIETILRRLTTDDSLQKATLMNSFYLARALEKVGRYGEFATYILDQWRTQLAVNLSTWAEYFPRTRSDCHAWSAWIARDFLMAVLGINPGKPGFAEILIRPRTDGHGYARGSMPTPVGMVAVDWRKEADGVIMLRAQTPEGVPVVVELPGCAPRRWEDGGAIEMSSAS